MSNELAKPVRSKKAKQDIVVQSAGLAMMNPDTITAQLEIEQRRRDVLQKYIKQNLVDGVDFGKIHIIKDCPNKNGGCKNENHFSKPSLFKAGAEKFCSLLQLRATFKPDEDVLRMVGSQGTVAYICELVHIPSGEVVAEGRGSCALTEKMGVLNTTIKIAEKRAKIDAVLSLGLSDTFTQDEEDLVEQEKTQQEDGYNKMITMIEGTRNGDLLADIATRLEGSTIYTDQQKAVAMKKIEERKKQLGVQPAQAPSHDLCLDCGQVGHSACGNKS